MLKRPNKPSRPSRPGFITRDLPSSGNISLRQVVAEFNKGNNLLDYLGEDGAPSSAPLKLTDFYGKSADNSLSEYIHNQNVYIYGIGSPSNAWGYSEDTNQQNTDPTATETMYWNRGDQPFDGTLNGSFVDTASTGRLFRRVSWADEGIVYCQGNGRFGDIQGGTDYEYQGATSSVWAFPWQKITKGAHTFYGNYYNQVGTYPETGSTTQELYLVEYDNWALDPNDSTRGILSNRVARTRLFTITASSNQTNWNGQTWSKAHTTRGRYLCLEWQGYTNPNYYTKYYMSCNVR